MSAPVFVEVQDAEFGESVFLNAVKLVSAPESPDGGPVRIHITYEIGGKSDYVEVIGHVAELMKKLRGES